MLGGVRRREMGRRKHPLVVVAVVVTVTIHLCEGESPGFVDTNRIVVTGEPYGGAVGRGTSGSKQATVESRGLGACTQKDLDPQAPPGPPLSAISPIK